jgi:hypothetical protein
MNELQNVTAEAGASQPWWYVRAQLLILLSTLILFAVCTWAATPLLMRAF